MTKGPARHPVGADLARTAAYEALQAVRARDAYANLALPAIIEEKRLSERDAAFATELTYGTLRALGTYDTILQACVDRPLGALDPPVLDVLRLGAHQLLATRVATHAAVDQSVRLAAQRVNRGVAGLVNAVLRKVSQRDLESWLAELAPSADVDHVGNLALVHAHPKWIVEAIEAALGEQRDELATALAADNARPAVTLVARPGRSDVAELVAAGATPGRWAATAAVLDGGAPAGVAAVREGRAGVQDEGSQLVALALAAVPVEGAECRWLDLCAGPGGKAALLEGLAHQRNVQLVAVERQPHRARLVAGATVRSAVFVADGTVPAWRAGSFDRVLVDAPCSGLGALRRRPEARWRRQPSDVADLHRLQVGLLRSAVDAARVGGVVAYVTCSPHLEETRDVLAEVSAARADIDVLDARPYVAGVPALGPGPTVQLWPHRHGTDAMFLALLRRRMS